MKELIKMIQTGEHKLIGAISEYFRKHEFMSREDYTKLVEIVLCKTSSQSTKRRECPKCKTILEDATNGVDGLLYCSECNTVTTEQTKEDIKCHQV